TTTVRMIEERRRCRFIILDREPRDDYFLATETNEPEVGFFIVAYGFIKLGHDGNLGEFEPGEEPALLGAFNLAGCKGYPEVLPEAYLRQFYADSAATVPRMGGSVAFEMQRWIERDNHADNDVIVEGVIANNLVPTTVLTKTPGIFKVTMAQQASVVD